MFDEIFRSIADIAWKSPFAEVILELAHHLVCEITWKQFIEVLDDVLNSLHPCRIIAPVSELVIFQLVLLLCHSPFYQAKMIHVCHIVPVELFLCKGFVSRKVFKALVGWRYFFERTYHVIRD